MQRILALLVAFSLVAMFSGAALADGFGMCSYGSQVKQVASDQTTDQAQDAKTVATAQLPKTEVDKLLIAQTDKLSKSAPTTNK
jgi:hypothetical protein